MISRKLLTTVSLAGLLAGAMAVGANAQAALSGQVSSAEEGLMEGVLVSAKKEGSTVTTTVVSNAKGEFSFPADRMEPGHYNITIRAAGYVLAGPKQIDVAAGSPASAEVKLAKAKSIHGQLSNGEWIMSAPGDDQVKSFLPDCVGCHTLQRVFSAMHTHRRMEERVRPHGPLRAGKRADAPAASAAGRAAQRAPARRRQHDGCGGRVPGQRQHQQSRQRGTGVQARCRARRAAPPT